MDKKKGYKGNIYDRVGSVQCSNFFDDKVEEGEWKEESAGYAKGKFKAYLIIAAITFFIAFILDFIYLGGIEGILTSEMLGYGKEGIYGYTAAVGSLILYPIISATCLYLAFRRKEK